MMKMVWEKAMQSKMTTACKLIETRRKKCKHKWLRLAILK